MDVHGFMWDARSWLIGLAALVRIDRNTHSPFIGHTRGTVNFPLLVFTHDVDGADKSLHGMVE